MLCKFKSAINKLNTRDQKKILKTYFLTIKKIKLFLKQLNYVIKTCDILISQLIIIKYC